MKKLRQSVCNVTPELSNFNLSSNENNKKTGKRRSRQYSHTDASKIDNSKRMMNIEHLMKNLFADKNMSMPNKYSYFSTSSRYAALRSYEVYIAEILYSQDLLPNMPDFDEKFKRTTDFVIDYKLKYPGLVLKNSELDNPLTETEVERRIYSYLFRIAQFLIDYLLYDPKVTPFGALIRKYTQLKLKDTEGINVEPKLLYEWWVKYVDSFSRYHGFETPTRTPSV